MTPCGTTETELDVYEIIQGGAAYPPFIIRLWDDYIDDPFNLTDVSEITTCFSSADGGDDLILTLTDAQIEVMGNPVLGKVKIILSAAQTALLALVQGALLEISVVIGDADPVKFRIPNCYSVVESGC